MKTAATSVQLTLCSVRLPADAGTAAGVAFTADIGVLEIGAVGTGGTGGGVVGIGAAAATGAGVSAGAEGSGCGGAATGDGGGSAAAAASHDTQPHSQSSNIFNYTTQFISYDVKLAPVNINLSIELTPYYCSQSNVH